MKFIKAFFFASVFFTSLVTHGAEVIGSYSNGCISGAVELKKGSNYQIQKWGKDRNFGHPNLISFITDLSAKAKKNKLPNLLIGDLSSPLGGPFGPNSSHGSHQSGLDVDVSFDFAKTKLSDYELSHPKDIHIVDTNNNKKSNFNQNHVTLIYLAANDKRVERIFVAPGIKKVLCDVYKNSDRSWLSKVRPWFGHRAHMHVRLACPIDSPSCQKQLAPPDGDGCGYELESWLNPPKPAKNKKSKPLVKKKKLLPQKCQDLLAKHQ